MGFIWLSNLFVRHPYIILLSVSTFSGTCLIIPFALKDFPNFNDPQLGYQTRGTLIANKLTTWFNLIEETKENGSFTVNPKEYLYRQNVTNFLTKRKEQKKKQPGDKVYGQVLNSTRKRVSRGTHSVSYPDPDYSHVVLESAHGNDLFTLKSLQDICRIQEAITESQTLNELCVRRIKRKVCCRAWSLPNYVAFLNNRQSCEEITSEDVENTKKLLQTCSHYYHSAKINVDCSESKDACNLPVDCYKESAVFNILNYLTSTSFLPPNKTDEVILKQTMIFLPVACSTATLDYYYEISEKAPSYNGISIVAGKFGIKNLIFEKYLLRDAWLLSFGGLFVFACLWFFTESIFLTFMTIISIIFSLGLSYFLYTIVFHLEFFPFMNLLAIIIALGIGTDDVFVFCKTWKLAKESFGGPLPKLMSTTLQHAIVSMIITSFTTAVAFLASYISSITAIKCFSVFACSTVMSNCLIMMFWFPSCMIIYEQSPGLHFGNWFKAIYARLRCFRICTFRQICRYVPNCLKSFEKTIVDSTIKYRHAWFSCLSSVAVASGIVVFVYPRLQLPNSNEFQLLRNSHPFEKYEMDYKDKFWFTKSAQENEEMNLPLRFIWGLIPQDNGNYLKPYSYGDLKQDDNFNMSHPDSQIWLDKFCKNLRKQSFYKATFDLQLPNCFIETFRKWMSRKCEDPMENMDHTPCCESESFPYRSWVFDKCIVEAVSYLYATPPSYYSYGVAGPKFSKEEDPIVKVIVVEYESNYTYSLSYEYMEEFVNKVDNWFNEELKTAPETMRRGFFTSETEFYDLQRVLSDSTIVAVLVSMILSLSVLYLATLNVIISIFAILNIICSILVTMASLVLLGWKLNVLESIAISSAIGLAVDFTLHYTVSYKLTPNAENRLARANQALSNMLKPVTMAALTTGMVGALMLPSSVMAYIQIGTFLLLVMCVSWIYATFHLGSMLALAGPQRNFGQLTYGQLFCKTTKRRPRNVRRTAESDAHELDLLSKPETTSEGQNRTCSNRSPSAVSVITVVTPDDP